MDPGSKTFLVTLALLNLQDPALAPYSKQFAGPYQILFRQMSDCENQGTDQIWLQSNKLSKFNRTVALYSTKVNLSLTLNDDIKVVVNVAVFGNGGWKENYFVHDLGGICKAFKTHIPALAQQVFQQLGHRDCPIPPGHYTIHNLDLQSKIVWPFIPYNKYRAETWASKNHIRIACKRFFIDSVPRKEKIFKSVHHGFSGT